MSVLFVLSSACGAVTGLDDIGAARRVATADAGDARGRDGALDHHDAPVSSPDARSRDAGPDARDAGSDVRDAGSDVHPDAGSDANDAGPDVHEAGSDGGDGSCNPEGCPAPADDRLVFEPPELVVPAGQYGSSLMVVTGPWSMDLARPVGIHYESSSLTLAAPPYIQIIGSSHRLVFVVPADAVGQHGTLTAYATNGSIMTTAQLAVTVGGCVPLPESVACESFNCGTTNDGCGGSVSCGSCGGPGRYCFHQASLQPCGSDVDCSGGATCQPSGPSLGNVCQGGHAGGGGSCIGCQPSYECGPSEGFDPNACQCVLCSPGCFSVNATCVCPP